MCENEWVGDFDEEDEIALTVDIINKAASCSNFKTNNKETI